MAQTGAFETPFIFFDSSGMKIAASAANMFDRSDHASYGHGNAHFAYVKANEAPDALHDLDAGRSPQEHPESRH